MRSKITNSQLDDISIQNLDTVTLTQNNTTAFKITLVNTSECPSLDEAYEYSWTSLNGGSLTKTDVFSEYLYTPPSNSQNDIVSLCGDFIRKL